MRTWVLARIRLRCGLCGKHVEANDKVLAIELPLLSNGRRRYRCTDCAGEPAPEIQDLAPAPALEWSRFNPPPIPPPEQEPDTTTTTDARPLSDLADRIKDRLDRRNP